jgi:hypothetical protein
MLADRERAYDHYVTVEQPGSWNRGYNAAYYGEPFDDEGEPSEKAYQDGWNQGVSDSAWDFAAGVN